MGEIEGELVGTVEGGEDGEIVGRRVCPKNVGIDDGTEDGIGIDGPRVGTSVGDFV